MLGINTEIIRYFSSLHSEEEMENKAMYLSTYEERENGSMYEDPYEGRNLSKLNLCDEGKEEKRH